MTSPPGRRLGRHRLQGHQRALRRRRRRRSRGSRRVIDELGYEASLVAQSLRNHRTNVIGILVADLEPFSTELLKGAAGRDPRHRLRAGGLLRRRPRRRPRRLGAALPVSRLGGTLIDGAVLVTPTVVDGRTRRPGGRGRPAHRPVGPADRRLRQPARRPAGDRAPARARPPPDRLPRRPARPGVGPAARAGLPRGDGGRRRRRSTPSLVRRRRVRPQELAEVGARTARPATTGRPPCSPPTTSPPSRRCEVARDAGPARARRPVGRRLRQHPRVARCHAAADHGRPADPGDGPRARSSCCAAARRASTPDDTHITLATDLVVAAVRRTQPAAPDRTVRPGTSSCTAADAARDYWRDPSRRSRRSRRASPT